MFEKIEIIRRLLATLVVAIGSLGCALRLYRFSRGKTRPVPVITNNTQSLNPLHRNA